MIEEARDEILYSHNLRNKDCIPSLKRNLCRNSQTETRFSHTV